MARVRSPRPSSSGTLKAAVAVGVPACDSSLLRIEDNMTRSQSAPVRRPGGSRPKEHPACPRSESTPSGFAGKEEGPFLRPSSFL